MDGTGTFVQEVNDRKPKKDFSYFFKRIELLHGGGKTASDYKAGNAKNSSSGSKGSKGSKDKKKK